MLLHRFTRFSLLYNFSHKTTLHQNNMVMFLLSHPLLLSLCLFPQSPVVSVGFARFHPNLLVGGTYSGQIVLWDNRSHRRTPVQRTPLSAAAHTVRLPPLSIWHTVTVQYNTPWAETWLPLTSLHSGFSTQVIKWWNHLLKHSVVLRYFVNLSQAVCCFYHWDNLISWLREFNHILIISLMI